MICSVYAWLFTGSMRIFSTAYHVHFLNYLATSGSQVASHIPGLWVLVLALLLPFVHFPQGSGLSCSLVAIWHGCILVWVSLVLYTVALNWFHQCSCKTFRIMPRMWMVLFTSITAWDLRWRGLSMLRPKSFSILVSSNGTVELYLRLSSMQVSSSITGIKQ